MKALVILKALANYSICVIKGKEDLLLVKDAVDELVYFLKSFKTLQSNYEAQEIIIADLKKQLEPKSCYGCKHLVLDDCCTLETYCSRSDMHYHDNYEPKDNK